MLVVSWQGLWLWTAPSSSSEDVVVVVDEEVDHELVPTRLVKEQEEEEEAILDGDGGNNDDDTTKNIQPQPQVNLEEDDEPTKFFLSDETNNEANNDDENDNGDDDDDNTDDDDDNNNEPEPTSHYITGAPRTHVGPYNEILPNTKYLIYSPSGGFNNQREELECAMEIAKLTNRTLYVPPVGKHEQLWRAYDRLRGYRDLFPMDRVLDFPYLETYGIKLVPLDMAVSPFVLKFSQERGSARVKIIEDFVTWHREDVLQKLVPDRHPLVFLHGDGMYHRWFLVSTMVLVKRHVRYAPYLRQLALKIAKQYFGGQPFYAMHIRMGDYTGRQVSDSIHFVRSARGKNWKVGRYAVYVATEPNRDTEFFQPLVSAFNVTFSTSLPKSIMHDFLTAFPPGKLRGDLTGLLEQLLCAMAIDFIGTPFSTFTSFIEFMRKQAQFSFPEIYVPRKKKEEGEKNDGGNDDG